MIITLVIKCENHPDRDDVHEKDLIKSISLGYADITSALLSPQATSSSSPIYITSLDLAAIAPSTSKSLQAVIIHYLEQRLSIIKSSEEVMLHGGDTLKKILKVLEEVKGMGQVGGEAADAKDTAALREGWEVGDSLML